MPSAISPINLSIAVVTPWHPSLSPRAHLYILAPRVLESIFCRFAPLLTKCDDTFHNLSRRHCSELFASDTFCIRLFPSFSLATQIFASAKKSAKPSLPKKQMPSSSYQPHWRPLPPHHRCTCSSRMTVSLATRDIFLSAIFSFLRRCQLLSLSHHR